MGLSFCEAVSARITPPQIEGLLFVPAVGININKLN